nr:hypothetical protein QQAWYXWE_QQAWYXWE_CDS_0014 [Microvirus sp.]
MAECFIDLLNAHARARNRARARASKFIAFDSYNLTIVEPTPYAFTPYPLALY